ncbi:hypothetical protein K7432_010481 [Basidiobolus ranarum]|uniref:BAH domain-containing protein n=1 Tax=Basidiobolus ranarum TaxID=34480 RepID=A0ABR2WNR5_9FUNG
MRRLKRKLSVKKKWTITRKLNFTQEQKKVSVLIQKGPNEVFVNGTASQFFSISNTRSTTTTLKRQIIVEIPVKRRRTFEDSVLVVIPKFDKSNKAVVDGDETGIIQLLTKYIGASTEEGSQEKYYELYLDNFVFYNTRGEPVELAEDIDCDIYFDGIFSVPDSSVPSARCKMGNFVAFSIGGYGTSTQKPLIWIQSTVQDDTWYLLKNPAKRYIKSWEKFFWKTQFIKYIIDFVQVEPERPFSDIKDVFYKWIHRTYRQDVSFREWASKIREKDMDFVVAANSNFLWSQVLSLGEDFAQLPFFSDSCIVKKELHRISTKLKWLEYTSVTPKAMVWFRNLFGRHMHKISLHPDSQSDPIVVSADTSAGQITGFDVDFVPSVVEWREPILIEEGIYNEIVYGGFSIKVGDVVELYRDQSTNWESAGGRWIAQVTQLIKDAKNGSFRMVWLHAPCQTVIGDVENYDPKELFYTTFCQCDDYQPINCIKRKCEVHFHKDTCPGNVLCFTCFTLYPIKIREIIRLSARIFL